MNNKIEYTQPACTKITGYSELWGRCVGGGGGGGGVVEGVGVGEGGRGW